MENIKIIFKNKNANSGYIVVFQKPTPIGTTIYKNLFPVAWKVIALSSDQSEPVIYPINSQISVIDYQDEYNPETARTTSKNANLGDVWKFINEGSSITKLLKTDQKGQEGVIACQNDSKTYIGAGLSKDDKLLVFQEKVGQGETAKFQLTPKIYIGFISDIKEGDLIKSDISSQSCTEIDLTGIKGTTVILSMDKDTGRKTFEEKGRIVV